MNDSNKKRMVIIAGFILIFLMVGSMFLGGDNEEESDGFNYNGYYFYRVGNFWEVNINNNLMKFQYSPKDVEGLGPSFLGNTKVVYFFYDEDLQSIASFYDNVFKVGGYNVMYGCNNDDCDSLQPKDCKESTSALMIYFERAEDGLIFDKRDNCIVFRGDEENLNKLAYWFIYRFLGVF